MSEELGILEYGKIDYPTILLRQLDRIMSIRTSISTPITKIELARYRSAILALYMVSPRKVREEVGAPPNGSLEDLDAYLVRLRDALERHGLIGVKILEVGSFEGGRDADIHEEGD